MERKFWIAIVVIAVIIGLAICVGRILETPWGIIPVVIVFFYVIPMMSSKN